MEYLIKEKYENTYEINKSKFISILLPLDSANDISALLGQIKKDYPKANHYCYAYVCKEETIINKSSDDKEPAGTAGVVILKSLNNKNIVNALLVVVRYFGGIKLGAGGLTRAYNTAATSVIDKATLYNELTYYTFKVDIDFNLDVKFEQFIKSLEGFIIDKDYTDKLQVTFALKNNNIDPVNDFLIGKYKITSNGQIKKITEAQ